MQHLAESGWQLAVLPVDSGGQVLLPEAASAISAGTTLVSVMFANNEVDSIQPIRTLADLAHAAGAVIHVDAAQAVGKIPVDVDVLGADLLTLAGHKFYAPKGVGALFVRSGTPLATIQFGVGHENGLRPARRMSRISSRLARRHGWQSWNWRRKWHACTTCAMPYMVCLRSPSPDCCAMVMPMATAACPVR
jgi:cysteine sulfinate desulfinase/cysteine desulfurase-like protein